MAQDMCLKHFRCASLFIFANFSPYVLKTDKFGVIVGYSLASIVPTAESPMFLHFFLFSAGTRGRKQSMATAGLPARDPA
jgi:hypothetical protein